MLRISFVLSILLRDGKVEAKRNRELLWLYTVLLAPRCGINPARMGLLRTAVAGAQDANHSICLRHKSMGLI